MSVVKRHLRVTAPAHRFQALRAGARPRWRARRRAAAVGQRPQLQNHVACAATVLYDPVVPSPSIEQARPVPRASRLARTRPKGRAERARASSLNGRQRPHSRVLVRDGARGSLAAEAFLAGFGRPGPRCARL